MLRTETLHQPSENYMKNQVDIHEKMRGILVDWLVEVHLKFKLVPETLYLTVNLIDRYLEMEVVKRDKLQLVGVTAMLIACKYEEIYPPEVKDFVYITDNAYTKQEIMDQEYLMLKKFNFNVTVISSFRFIERFTKLSQDNEAIFYFAQYMLELSLVEYKMIKYKPSLLASGALYLAHKILSKTDPWPLKLEQYSGLREKDVRPCAKDM
jgi:cyclin B